MTEMKLKALAEHLGGEVLGDPDLVVRSLSSIPTAGPAEIVYLKEHRMLEELERSRAGAVILDDGLMPPSGMSAIRVADAAVAAAEALELFHPRRRFFREISAQAVIGEGVELGDDVGIGPGACIGHGVKIGAGTEIHPLCSIGEGTVIGENCTLYPNVLVYHECTIGDRVTIHGGAVIGADGFGYVQARGESAETPVRHLKVPQIGTVIIGDDVEIGANTNIDRATLDATIIGEGTKIDDSVMIGHNTKIGRHCLIVAQAGISGSAEIGDYVTIAGQAGLIDHVKIGDGAVVGAQAGVVKDVPPGESVLGSPAIGKRKARQALLLIERLPELKKAIQELREQTDAELREGVPGTSQP